MSCKEISTYCSPSSNIILYDIKKQCFTIKREENITFNVNVCKLYNDLQNILATLIKTLRVADLLIKIKTLRIENKQ